MFGGWTDLVYPHVGGHHLVLQINVYQLGEFEPELDGEGLGEVWDRPDQPVVVVEQVVIQPLGVRVSLSSWTDHTSQYIKSSPQDVYQSLVMSLV